jgi:hypothetical protein
LITHISSAKYINLSAVRKVLNPTLAGNPDYKPWILALSKTGYSEVPETWRKLITGAIQKNRLD